MSGFTLRNVKGSELTYAELDANFTNLEDTSDTAKGDALLGVKHTGTGAVGRTQHSKNEETVSAFDYMTAAQIADVQNGTLSVDVTSALQAAIDACIAARKKLFLPFGFYSISGPLFIYKWSGTAFSYVSLTIEGERMPWEDDGVSSLGGSKIVCSHINTFGIGIQNARSVNLIDVEVLGQNDFSGESGVPLASNRSYLATNANFVINSCRDSRYSPYAGIVVDPFGTAAPADGGYPNLSAYYVASAAGSSNLEFERVLVRGFVTGVCLSPNGTTANCSEMTFRHCHLEYNKVGLAICQDQSRNIHWYGGSNYFALYCFDGHTYGEREGHAPKIFGCSMNGKYLFNTNNSFAEPVAAYGIHAEQFMSIGFLGGTATVASAPFTFSGCNFQFTDFGNGIVADRHLVAMGPVRFEGCEIQRSTTSMDGTTTPTFPIRMTHRQGAPITFADCSFSPSSQNEFALAPALNSGTIIQDEVYFENSVLNDSGTRGPTGSQALISHHVVRQSASTCDRVYAPVGAIFKFNAAGSLSRMEFCGNRDSLSRTTLGALAVTDVGDGTATFTVADGTIVRTGDLIYTTTATSLEEFDGTTESVPYICLGVVSDVTVNDITIEGFPQSLGSDTYTLQGWWWPRYHQASTGDTASNTTISNVTNPTAWAIGNKIQGSGITAGTYITNIVGATFTISRAASATATGIRLYDADMFQVVGQTKPGISSDNGDASKTLRVDFHEPTQLWNTPLTAHRTVALSTSNALAGDKFRIIRGAGATGAFQLQIGTGPLVTLQGFGTWCDVEYNGSAWVQTAYGGL